MGKGILVRGAQGRGMGHDRTRLTIKWGKWVLPAEAALHGAKRPATGRPCAAANALRTACRAAWGKWVSPAKAAPHGAKTACCRAALRCGKRAADGLPCGKGFACGSGCPARFPASGVASPLQDAAGRKRTDRRRPNGSSALAT